MAASVHLRPLALAPPLPSLKTAPNSLHLPGKPGARMRGCRSRLALFVCAASSPAPGTPVLILVSRRQGEGDRGQVGGVDPAPRGRQGGGGAGAGAQAHLRRRGHARLPVRRLAPDLPPRRGAARQAAAGTLRLDDQLVWLLALVVLPARSNIYMRFGLVVFLALLSVWILPNRVWKVRNSALAIVARRINWKKLTAMETIDIFFNYIRQIFKNIFDHAEQISKIHYIDLLSVTTSFESSFSGNDSSRIRGDPSNHKIYFLTESSFGIADLFSLLCLFALMGLASFSDKLI
ncbi:hypothetical protein PR202_gb01065 [Eleusine coracana subsp. coracana]|uniref:Uncharacterized protein n=1 Tax=Eleusine coracana subsp. coracana TaxID=191504 RepID=A0AAV5DVN1_ELECO|nr:hypothetical protein PR202_gb01065 [Eleusine coracana subsp. coracana]